MHSAYLVWPTNVQGLLNLVQHGKLLPAGDLPETSLNTTAGLQSERQHTIASQVLHPWHQRLALIQP